MLRIGWDLIASLQSHHLVFFCFLHFCSTVPLFRENRCSFPGKFIRYPSLKFQCLGRVSNVLDEKNE
ncbi:hypothetical protein K1719_025888 [Acacia pycnantha]|nr:hypothetical protein K1719_025888 [Acacia pycnantha]